MTALPESKRTGILAFVGFGLSKFQITSEASATLKDADVVFYETYTSFYYPDIREAIEELGVRKCNVIGLNRKDLEEDGGKIVFDELEKGRKVAFVVAGDPFFATTHTALKIEALKKGYRVRYVPGINIYSYAVSASGLFNYKFGESATIVYKRNGILFTYPYVVLSENLKRGLHTFFYLDIDPKLGPLTSSEALEILLEIEKNEKHGIISKDRKVLVLERLGWPDERLYYAPISWFLKRELNPPHSLIIPGKLHFVEKEAIEVFSVA